MIKGGNLVFDGGQIFTRRVGMSHLTYMFSGLGLELLCCHTLKVSGIGIHLLKLWWLLLVKF